MLRQYCKPEMLKEYIKHYTNRRASWERFYGILRLDFSPEFIKVNESKIKLIYSIQLSLSEEKNVKYNRVA